MSAWITKDWYLLRKRGAKQRKVPDPTENLWHVSLLSRKMHGLKSVCIVPGASDTFQVPVSYLRSRRVPGPHHAHKGSEELRVLPPFLQSVFLLVSQGGQGKTPTQTRMNYKKNTLLPTPICGSFAPGRENIPISSCFYQMSLAVTHPFFLVFVQPSTKPALEYTLCIIRQGTHHLVVVFMNFFKFHFQHHLSFYLVGFLQVPVGQPDVMPPDA